MAQTTPKFEHGGKLGRVLIVEDDDLIALDIVSALTEARYDVLGPAASVAAALIIIEWADLDGVVLDVDLFGQNSYVVADALIARGISFVFASGYPAVDLPSRYQLRTVLTKPFIGRELVHVLKEAMTGESLN